jgi:hypothetical protein
LLATKRFLKVLDRTMCFNHAFIEKAFGAATPNYEFKNDVGEEARLNVVAAVIASNLNSDASIVVFAWVTRALIVKLLTDDWDGANRKFQKI